MRIFLPWPPKELQPNSGGHYAKKFKAIKKYREDCQICAMALVRKRTFTGNIPTMIIFHPPDERHRDLDNALASVKRGLDGVCIALGINDKHLRPITLDWGQVKRGGEIEIRLEEL